MSSNNKQPKIVELGANQRGAASSVNLDVSGTVGPDYLGQETTDVDGHPADRPGVLSRLPERCPEDGYELSKMDTGEELPVLLSSSMSADPCNGVQGSYTQIIEGECVRCGYDRLREAVVTMAGERQRTCNACGAVQERREENGYRMPKTDRERAREVKDASKRIGDAHRKKVYYKEGRRFVETIDDSDRVNRVFLEEIEALYWLLVSEEVLDPVEAIEDLRVPERLLMTIQLLPDGWSFTKVDEEDEESDE